MKVESHTGYTPKGPSREKGAQDARPAKEVAELKVVIKGIKLGDTVKK